MAGPSGSPFTSSSRFLYVLGGQSGGEFADGELAPVLSGGRIGSFQPLAHAMSHSRRQAQAVVIGEYLYVMGGQIEKGQPDGQIERARIGSDGDIGPFEAVLGLSLRSPRRGLALVKYGHSLMVVGGDGGVFDFEPEVATFSDRQLRDARATRSREIARPVHLVTGEPSRSALAAADLPVTVSVTRQIRKGSERLARELLRDAIDRASGFPGHQGAFIFDRGPGTFTVVFRFDSSGSLRRWEESAERAEILERLGEVTLAVEIQQASAATSRRYARNAFIPLLSLVRLADIQGHPLPLLCRRGQLNKRAGARARQGPGWLFAQEGPSRPEGLPAPRGVAGGGASGTLAARDGSFGHRDHRVPAPYSWRASPGHGPKSRIPGGRLISAQVGSRRWRAQAPVRAGHRARCTPGTGCSSGRWLCPTSPRGYPPVPGRRGVLAPISRARKRGRGPPAFRGARVRGVLALRHTRTRARTPRVPALRP